MDIEKCLNEIKNGKIEALQLLYEELDPVYISSRFSRAFILERLSRLNEAVDEWKLIIKYLHDSGFEIEAAYPEGELARLESKINSTVS